MHVFPMVSESGFLSTEKAQKMAWRAEPCPLSFILSPLSCYYAMPLHTWRQTALNKIFFLFTQNIWPPMVCSGMGSSRDRRGAGITSYELYTYPAQ